MTRLDEIIAEHKVWVEKNFPSKPFWQPLLGVGEEVGELNHAVLKRAQGILMEEDHDADIRDAVGDIVIFLMHFCSIEGVDLMDCIEEAWGRAGGRDWTKAEAQEVETECTFCGGNGSLVDQGTCPTCEGHGVVYEVPQGVEDEKYAYGARGAYGDVGVPVKDIAKAVEVLCWSCGKSDTDGSVSVGQETPNGAYWEPRYVDVHLACVGQ